MTRLLFSIWLISLLLMACDKPSAPDGTLIKISPKIYLELNHNGVSGELDLITIEPKSQQSVPIDQQTIDLQIFTSVITTKPIRLTLKSITDSYFNVRTDDLIGIYEFRGGIEQLQIQGQTYHDVRFIYPTAKWWETTRRRDKRLRQQLQQQLKRIDFE